MASKRGKRYRRLTMEKKAAIIKLVKSGRSQADVSKEFVVSKQTVSDFLRNEDKILEAAEKPSGAQKMNASQGVHLKLEDALVMWLNSMIAKPLPVSGCILKQKAKTLALRMDIMDFKFNDGWLRNFKHRNDLKFKKMCGGSCIVDSAVIELDPLDPRNRCNKGFYGSQGGYQLGLGAAVVLQLCSSLPKRDDNLVVADNFFTGPQLVEELSRMGIFYIGTDTEGLVSRLLQWAESESTPPLLHAYATGLLAAAMEVQDIAANYREANARLVPAMLRRLWELAQASDSRRDHVPTARSDLSATSTARPQTGPCPRLSRPRRCSSRGRLTRAPRRRLSSASVPTAAGPNWNRS
ncbi:hypothetical protein HPB51_016553 [Rhipicephalus microplus]|uniref:HTH CENPB-type domain-containing protein n=1 Tax=Rhipicephalus microplus TaxID=6941 RepID=A0A9J6EAU4_RHIMP|nr:hypothetical protein HPB51_016553 [Rhipicephalus microplus]